MHRSMAGNLSIGAALLLSVLTGGCATGGAIGPAPTVSDPATASEVTVFRGGSLVGLFGPIRLRINGRDAFNIYRNQQYSLRLDSGLHLLEFSIGLNECRRVVFIEPGRHYRIRLVPNCVMVADVD